MQARRERDKGSNIKCIKLHLMKRSCPSLFARVYSCYFCVGDLTFDAPVHTEMGKFYSCFSTVYMSYIIQNTRLKLDLQ